MQKLTLTDYQKMPWKNGQGVTYEIYRDKGETLEDFGYRISMADVASDGAFSHFLGRERILTVLNGDGIVLTVNQQEKITLKPQQIFNFSGESEVYSELINRAIRDLNVIFDPKFFTAKLSWLNQNNHLTTQADTVFILANADNTQVFINDKTFELNQFDSVKIDHQTANVVIKNGCVAVIEIFSI